MYYYFQQEGGEEEWQALPAKLRGTHETTAKPRYYTVLAISHLVTDDLTAEDRDKLKYEGPLYFDWDVKDDDVVYGAEQATKLLAHMITLGVDIKQVALFATGGRGYHAEIPMGCFMEKPSAQVNLPIVYRELAHAFAVDSLDLRIYSRGRGRMWRTTNVQREKGNFKVPITWAELQVMTPEMYSQLIASPRHLAPPEKATQALGLTIEYDKAVQSIKAKVGRKRKKPLEAAVIRQMSMPSLHAFMEGRGVKADVGFQQISLQLGVVADTMGWSETELVTRAAGLIESHSGDGNRYNTPEKRTRELVRMHRYLNDNPTYEFSIGALKTLMNHDAPDLDGIPVSKEEVEENITAATTLNGHSAEGTNGHDVLNGHDAYSDIAGGVDMTKYGIYVDSEWGKKRICALSFDDVETYKDAASGNVSGYSAKVLVNGKATGRQALEVETFSGLQAFNRYAARQGHAMQGTDVHVRSVMLRVAQQAEKSGKVKYVAKREGLDVINIAGHPNPELHEPFLIWADSRGVQMEARAAATGVEMSFQGYPDPRGTYRTDLADAPLLKDWVNTPEKEIFKGALHALIGCQRPDVIGNFLGWYTACFYRMLFNKVYDKFPLLHVNGSAGAGKTEMNRALLHLFYYNQTPRELTPQSSIFAIQQHLAGSSSIPLMIDEYKPHEMSPELHNRLKLLWRDAYNNREVTKGGGNRDSDDFRSLNMTQISAPIVFISEAMEEEPATMERVVMVSIVRPPPQVATHWHAKFQEFSANKRSLGVLGQYIAGQIVGSYSLDQLRAEFDELYVAAQAKYMLSAADLTSGLAEDVLRAKQGAKQRTVYNFCVSQFGLRKFRTLIEMIYGKAEFAESFETLEEAVFSKIGDLLPATQAEYLKVINTFAAMSFEKPDSNDALISGFHYAHVNFGGKDCIELSMRSCYMRYRVHCKNIGTKPLFGGEPAFLHAMRDSTAIVTNKSTASKIAAPGNTFVFDMTELRKMGVDNFRP